MATGNTTAVKRGRNRTLGVRTWLGAGALTLGVGAALAGATGIAQADTGDHHSGTSASSSKHETGPKRAAGVASSKRVSSVANVTKSPVSAAAVSSKPSGSTKPAAAGKSVTAAAIPPINQTINTPFGPISLVANVTAPDPGDSGPVAVDVTAKTPLGGAKFSIDGDQTFTTTPTLKSTTTLTDGTLVVPPVVAFAASAAGAFVGAGLSAYDSLNTFFAAVRSRNIGGAVLAWAEAAPRFTNALLFGRQTLDLPLQSGDSGPSIVAHIPVGGFFSPARSLSVDWDDYSYTDESTGAEIALVGGSINFAGSKFGGAAPAFLKIFGL